VTQSFFDPIPSNYIAGYAAYTYSQEIRLAMERIIQDLDRLSDFSETSDVRLLAPLPIEEVLSRVSRVGVEHSIASILSPESTVAIGFVATDRRGNDFDILDIHACFASTPETFTHAFDDILLLEAMGSIIDQQLEDAREKRQALDRRIEATKHTVAKQLGKFERRSAGGAKPRRSLTSKSRELRQLATDLEYTNCVITALAQARHRIGVEIRKQQERVQSVLDMLKGHIQRESSAINDALVVLRPLNEVFVSLLDATFLEHQVQRSILGASVENVTLHGLASIVGARTIAIEEIVEAIFSANSNMRTCWPGGWQREEDSAAIILPPLSINDSTALRSELARRDSKARKSIFIGDSARAGCNVIRFGFVHPGKLEEIFSPMSQAAYVAASQSPSGMLASEKSFNEAFERFQSSSVVHGGAVGSVSPNGEPAPDTLMQDVDGAWSFIMLPPDWPTSPI
jgi:hypothetical protein